MPNFSSSHPEQCPRTQRKQKKAGQTSINTHPARAPKGKTSRSRGTDHRHSLYSRSPEGASDRRLCRQSESKKWDLTVGCRGYRSSTRVGSVAPLGNTKEDNYYRNDSLKYCRHEEKREKKVEKVGARKVLNSWLWVVSARLQICRLQMLAREPHTCNRESGQHGKSGERSRWVRDATNSPGRDQQLLFVETWKWVDQVRCSHHFLWQRQGRICRASPTPDHHQFFLRPNPRISCNGHSVRLFGDGKTSRLLVSPRHQSEWH
ncbi:hypothetical protein C8A00DRAFT_18633 [Chaetomidium leptoderma]|uniref:Uncharacterized protein n=1 Tax=Chaetomidium leptoderma TaxID=669021 RepID=A0AAN6ZUU6_9PEZI|nr:hypothetical protein C8A00DRAFT_18633 [Chaetomidium leptoderma]